MCKTHVFVFFLMLALISILYIPDASRSVGAQAFNAPSVSDMEPEAAPGEYVITWQDDASTIVGLADIQASGIQVIDHIDAINVSVVTLPYTTSPQVQNTQPTLDALRHDPRVVTIEPNYFYETLTHPNDPNLDEQWGWNAINAYDAWHITMGNANVVVAVVDTGIQRDHPDLDSKILAGYDFVEGDTSPDDSVGHGTHVAGIAAAETDNNSFGAGACPLCTILPVRVIEDRRGKLSDVVAGITYAADNGAQVINLSLGGVKTVALENAVNYAWQKGAFLSCAAGNNGKDMPFYPAAYNHCFSVAATDQNDTWASFSNYGTWVDIAAPGASIYSTLTDSDYGSLIGTSMASPHVAGIAGLLSSQGLTNNQIRTRLCLTADDIAGTGTYWQCGRLNAYRAVESYNIVNPLPYTVYLPLTLADQ